MSDTNQTSAPESTGGEQFSWRNLPGGEEFAAGMAEFATRDSGESESETDIGERMSAEDYSTGEDASETAVQPAAQTQSKPMDMQSLMIQMQQQQLQMFSEMQQQIAMQQSQSVAAAVQAALAQLGLGQQQQAPQEVDPIAALDPDDPDYFFKKTDAELMMLKKQNQELVNRLENERMQQMQAVQQQQAMQQQQTFVSQVSADLGRAVDYVFQGWPDSPQVQALKQLAANTVDAEWHATGYKPEGYAIGIRKAQQMLKSMEGMKHSFAAPKTNTPPVGRGMVPSASVPDTSGGRTWRQMLDGTRKNDAFALREAIKNGLH